MALWVPLFAFGTQRGFFLFWGFGFLVRRRMLRLERVWDSCGKGDKPVSVRGGERGLKTSVRDLGEADPFSIFFSLHGFGARLF